MNQKMLKGKPLRNTMLCCMSLLCWISFTASTVEASHFRYGHLTWKARPDISPTTVEFSLINAFRRSGYTGTGADGLAVTGDIFDEEIGETTLLPGDGTLITGTAGSLQYRVIAYDPTANWVIGVALDPTTGQDKILHNYPTDNNAGSPWVAYIDSCCRISTLANAPDADYRVETLVDLTKTDHSPVSSLPPIVSCPQNSICSFIVPGADAQPGTQLSWRLATGVEDGFIVQPSGLTIDPTTGIVTWITTGRALNSLWATQAIIEKRDTATAALLTKVAVDYIIRIVPPGDPPVIEPPPNTPPICNTTVPAFVGSEVTFQVGASDPDSADQVTLNTAGLPVGATTTPALPVAGNPVAVSFRWTPTSADVGTHVINFIATDSGGLQALCPVTINVMAHGGGCPNDSDCDGLPNDWETHGVDTDGNGTPDLNLAAFGADPNHKDIFVEIDYMVLAGESGHTHKPKADALRKVITAFANAPVSNPDGVDGINLHIDAGSDTVMNPVTGVLWDDHSKADALDHDEGIGTFPMYFWGDFDAIKRDHFVAERHNVFHYCVFAHGLGQSANNKTSGVARPGSLLGLLGPAGSDFIVTLGRWATNPGEVDEQAGTLMHELGHNLGLRHGGDDGGNYEPNYLSVMNYSFQTLGLLIGSDFGHIDYSRFILPELNENSLNEAVGLSGVAEAASYGTLYYDENGRFLATRDINGAIDWNGDGDGGTDTSVKVDINNSGGLIPRGVLRGSDNWAEIVFDGGWIGQGKGEPQLPEETEVDELTEEQDQLIPHPLSVAVKGPGYVVRTPCRTIPYQVTIMNTGDGDDVYRIASSKTQPWVDTSTLPETVTLAAGVAITFNLPVTVPLGTPAGTIDTLMIVATSTANQLVFDTIETTSVAAPDLDDDGDGLCNDNDHCPNTPAGAIVNADGCSIAQLVPCAGPASGGKWKNHGQYVVSVIKTATAFEKAKVITPGQWVQIVTGAARSKCGWDRRWDRDRDWQRNWDYNRDWNWGASDPRWK